MNLHPLDDCLEKAQRYISYGAKVFQQFTCAKCGTKQTMDTPNKFFTTGRCEKCGYVTDIRKDGCNYMLTFG